MKYRTDHDLQDQDGWSVTQKKLFSIADCSKKSSIKKIESSLDNGSLYLDFKRCISFATNLAANSVIYSESCQTLSPSVCTHPPEVAVLFNWNLSSRPFLVQAVDLDLLLCTELNSEHVVLCPIFFLEGNEWLKDLSEAMSAAW